MQLSRGGSIGVDIPKADPECVRIQMASKTSHMERVLTDDEAYKFTQEIMDTLKLKERLRQEASEETKLAIELDPSVKGEMTGTLPDVAFAEIAFGEYLDETEELMPTVPSIESVQDPRY